MHHADRGGVQLRRGLQRRARRSLLHRRLGAAGVGRGPVLVSTAAELRAAEDEDADESCRRGDGRRDHERTLRGPEQAPRISALGERSHDLLPPIGRELEKGRRLERAFPGLQPPDLVRARAARDEVLGHLLTRASFELALDKGEQLELVRMLLGHQSLDSVRSTAVPSRSASSVRPRKMRDFTVPSGTPVISAISA